MRRHWAVGALAFLSFTMLKPTASSAHHNQFQGFDPQREQVVTGTVVGGKVVLDGVSLPEGTVVTVLAKELESATASLRVSLYAIPASARYVIDRWDGLRALSAVCDAIDSAVAGDTESAIVHQSVLESGLAFLPKPFTWQTLTRKVHDVLVG